MVVERITNFESPQHAFLSLNYYYYFFLHCFGLAWQTEPKRRDSSQSRGLPYVNDLMGFLPFAYLMFFPLLDFSCSFSRMIDNNDVMVTCFIKMAVLFFTKGFSYFASIKPDSTLGSEKKIISWYFFTSKLKCLVHGLSYRAGVLCIRCSSNMFKFVLYLNTRSLSL